MFGDHIFRKVTLCTPWLLGLAPCFRTALEMGLVDEASHSSSVELQLASQHDHSHKHTLRLLPWRLQLGHDRAPSLRPGRCETRPSLSLTAHPWLTFSRTWCCHCCCAHIPSSGCQGRLCSFSKRGRLLVPDPHRCLSG